MGSVSEQIASYHEELKKIIPETLIKKYDGDIQLKLLLQVYWDLKLVKNWEVLNVKEEPALKLTYLEGSNTKEVFFPSK